MIVADLLVYMVPDGERGPKQCLEGRDAVGSSFPE